MTMPSVVSSRHMPEVNKRGKTMIDQIGICWAACVAAIPSKRDLRGRVEPQSEQKAHEIHVPTLADQPEQRSENAGDQSRPAQHVVQGVLVGDRPFLAA